MKTHTSAPFSLGLHDEPPKMTCWPAGPVRALGLYDDGGPRVLDHGQAEWLFTNHGAPAADVLAATSRAALGRIDEVVGMLLSELIGQDDGMPAGWVDQLVAAAGGMPDDAPVERAQELLQLYDYLPWVPALQAELQHAYTAAVDAR